MDSTWLTQAVALAEPLLPWWGRHPALTMSAALVAAAIVVGCTALVLWWNKRAMRIAWTASAAIVAAAVMAMVVPVVDERSEAYLRAKELAAKHGIVLNGGSVFSVQWFLWRARSGAAELDRLRLRA